MHAAENGTMLVRFQPVAPNKRFRNFDGEAFSCKEVERGSNPRWSTKTLFHSNEF